jgi:hypothetical protein
MKVHEVRRSVHLSSTNHTEVFDNREQVFCLRSKKSEVRILSGVYHTTLSVSLE